MFVHITYSILAGTRELGQLCTCTDMESGVGKLPKIRYQLKEETWMQAQVCLTPLSVNFPLSLSTQLIATGNGLDTIKQTKQPVPYYLREQM